jgi:hypothetical protein
VVAVEEVEDEVVEASAAVVEVVVEEATVVVVSDPVPTLSEVVAVVVATAPDGRLLY